MLPDRVLLAASKLQVQSVENRCAQTILGRTFTTTDFSYPVVMYLANFRHVCEYAG